jgi:hypothetical protein
MHTVVGSTAESNTVSCPFETPYRAWFFNPPAGTVTGFPRKVISATEDGLIRARGYSKMFVKGRLYYYKDQLQTDKLDSISFYYDNADTISIQNCKVVDSFFVCCTFYIGLLSADSQFTADTTNVKGCESSEESQKQPDNAEYLLGKGSSKLQLYDQASSWMRAEELAIKEVCHQSVMHYASLQRMHVSGDQTQISTTMRYEQDLVVKNVKIISRHYDLESRFCTVWAACKKSDIYPWKEL